MISFIHRGGPEMASYRYRAAIPARELGASLNDLTADTLIFCKPMAGDDSAALEAREDGRLVIVDFCDDHFDDQHVGPLYRRLLDLADKVTCPTEAMRERILQLVHPERFNRDDFVHVVVDPYEFEEKEPHCHGPKCLWFGHGSNFASLVRVLPNIFAPLTVVSNIPLALPWSLETLREELGKADIVLLPSTAPTKSPNRAVEAIRQGCFVVAEPHPSINEFPDIWIGDIPEGIAWASQNPLQSNAWIKRAQKYVHTKFSPRTQADALRSLLARAKSASTSAAARSSGPAGLESMASTTAPT